MKSVLALLVALVFTLPAFARVVSKPAYQLAKVSTYPVRHPKKSSRGLARAASSSAKASGKALKFAARNF